MRLHLMILTVIAACALVPSLTPGFAQSQNEARPQNQDAALCSGQASSPDAGIEACTKVLEQEASDSARRRAIALTFRGLAWKAKGDIKNAVTDLTEAIGLDEKFVPAYEARADVLRDNNQCDLALPEYDKVIKLAPDRVPPYLSRALCLIDRNKADEARAALDEAIKRDANNAGGYAVIALGIKARLDVAKNDADGALKTFDAAIALDPKGASLYLDRAAIWSGKGDRDKALADCDQVIKLDENNAGGFAVAAHVLKARFQASDGKLDAAIGEYDEAVKLNPKLVALYIDRAALRDRKGDKEQALADYEAAIKADPASGLAYNARGDFYRAQGDYQHALADYDQAIEKQPNDLTAYGNRALVRFYKGDFAKAADDLKRVAAAQQVNAYPMLLLYLARARDGRKDARDELAGATSKLNKADWPYPVVELFLSKKTPPALESVAAKPEQRCEAQFYIGEWHLTRDAKPAAQKAFQAAVDSCPKDFVEYRGAVEELKRLN
jgi:tetratricopeptide (TPR) repeat protein